MKKLQITINKKVRKYNLYFLSTTLILLLVFSACKKQLDVKNPNDPTFDVNVTDETGLTAYAKGVVFWNGFNYGDAWLGDSYFSLPWGYHELMGDIVGGGQGSNNQTTTMGVPDRFQADPNDPSTVFINPSPQATSIIRTYNNSAGTTNGNNALYYEWTNMYGMINGCNLTLEHVDGISLSADKANTVKAWAYWWKGYAYAQLGTLYYAGLIEDVSNSIVDKFVNQAALIDESNKNLNQALTLLNGISNQGDYGAIISQLIPSQNQVGLGQALSSAQWVRTINTLLARNILLNHLAPFVNGNPDATITKSTISPMSSADWQAVIDYCNSGIKEGDYVFTGRTAASNSYFSPEGGSVAGILTASNQTTTYKLSERLVQQFKAGDNRLANFSTSDGTFYGDANTNSTRYSLVDGVDANLSGIPILGSREVGGLEIYIGPTFEENQLMLAEANIRSGNIAAGLALIDEVRDYQGAGVAHIGGSGLTLSQAMQELTMERLAALALRGLSYYDCRRWGWTYAIADGGGRYGCTLLFNGNVYTNATIDYNFMDYWDVPGDETEKNAPSADSAPVINPNY
ncbi:MAG TPA: RagB/SusD family nutrient uptake outer membrane protein [Chitinophagaceae bacterium]|jgi:SusD/RagB-like outer membrane lipoprotein|nr:RagB/SusD family nutrient uptake outer membrane protein [Chitinophagaceae bacterium]